MKQTAIFWILHIALIFNELFIVYPFEKRFVLVPSFVSSISSKQFRNPTFSKNVENSVKNSNVFPKKSSIIYTILSEMVGDRLNGNKLKGPTGRQLYHINLGKRLWFNLM